MLGGDAIRSKSINRKEGSEFEWTLDAEVPTRVIHCRKLRDQMVAHECMIIEVRVAIDRDGPVLSNTVDVQPTSRDFLGSCISGPMEQNELFVGHVSQFPKKIMCDLSSEAKIPDSGVHFSQRMHRPRYSQHDVAVYQFRRSYFLIDSSFALNRLNSAASKTWSLSLKSCVLFRFSNADSRPKDLLTHGHFRRDAYEGYFLLATAIRAHIARVTYFRSVCSNAVISPARIASGAANDAVPTATVDRAMVLVHRTEKMVMAMAMLGIRWRAFGAA